MSSRAALLRSLRFWTPQVLLSAAPSFFAAYRAGFSRASSVGGMLAGIVVFLVAYSSLWGSTWFRGRVPEHSAWDRALIYGAWMRSFYSLATLICFTLSVLRSEAVQPASFLFVLTLVLMILDGCSGMLAGHLVNWALQMLSIHTGAAAIDVTSNEFGQGAMLTGPNTLLLTFVTTLVQGALLTLILLLFALISRGGIDLNAWLKSRHPSTESPVALT